MKNIKKLSSEIIALSLERLVLEKDQINEIFRIINMITKIDIPHKQTESGYDKMIQQIQNLKMQSKNLNKIFSQI